MLVLVRDDHTCSQLTEYLRVGGPAMMQRRFMMHLCTKLAMDGGGGGGGKGGAGGKRGRGNGKAGGSAASSSVSGREALAEAERELLMAEFMRHKGPAEGKKKRRRKKGGDQEEEGEEKGGAGSGDEDDEDDDEEEEGDKAKKPKKGAAKGGKKRKRPEREEEVGPNQALQRVEEIFQVRLLSHSPPTHYRLTLRPRLDASPPAFGLEWLCRRSWVVRMASRLCLRPHPRQQGRAGRGPAAAGGCPKWCASHWTRCTWSSTPTHRQGSREALDDD